MNVNDMDRCFSFQRDLIRHRFHQLPKHVLPEVRGGTSGRRHGQALLWSTPYRSSSGTLMHIAAASMYQEQFQPACPEHQDWWLWILEQAAAAACESCSDSASDNSSSSNNNLFFEKLSQRGETVFDVFFQQWLGTAGKKRKIRESSNGIACRRVVESFDSRSLELVVASEKRLEALKTWIETELHQVQPAEESSSSVAATATATSCKYRCYNVSTPDNRSSSITDVDVMVVARFWRAFEMLIRAAEFGSVDMTRDLKVVPLLTTRLHGACPLAVARLAVALYPEQVRNAVVNPLSCRASSSCLPLHYLCAHGKKNNHRTSNDAFDDEHNSLMRALLEAYPKAAMTRDESRQDRLALHLALVSGKRNNHRHSLANLVLQAAPEALGLPDPVTGLPCFALAAASKLSTTSAARASGGGGDCVPSGNDLTVRPEDRLNRTVPVRFPNYVLHSSDEADKQDCEHLTIIYQLLHAFPQTLPHPASHT